MREATARGEALGGWSDRSRRERGGGADKRRRGEGLRRFNIFEGPLHCAPRQVRPLQVDWSVLARSIIYIASRRTVCVPLGLRGTVSYPYRFGEGRGGTPGARDVRHSFSRPIDGDGAGS